MAVFKKTITIDFATPRQKSIRDWLAENRLEPKTTTSLTVEVSMNIELSDFDEDEVVDYFEEHFPAETGSVERAYQHLAEGDVAAAMEELAREFGLAPPSHALAIADLLSGHRNPPHA